MSAYLKVFYPIFDLFCLQVAEDGLTLNKNPYSWNKASILKSVPYTNAGRYYGLHINSHLILLLILVVVILLTFDGRGEKCT